MSWNGVGSWDDYWTETCRNVDDQIRKANYESAWVVQRREDYGVRFICVTRYGTRWEPKSLSVETYRTALDSCSWYRNRENRDPNAPIMVAMIDKKQQFGMQLSATGEWITVEQPRWCSQEDWTKFGQEFWK